MNTQVIALRQPHRVDRPSLIPRRSKPRPWVIFGVVALGLLMSSLDQTIVATALNTLQAELRTSIALASWTMTVYALGMLLMLPVAGKLSEQFGRRRVFIASVALFTAASLCCGLATNIYMLVALRFVQALGGAGLTPSATGIIADHFGRSRDKALGLFGSIFSIGAMIGPIFGGLFVTYWSWRGIFFVNVPIGIALIVLGLRTIPADPPRSRRHPANFDLPGMAMLGVGILGAMLAFNALGDGGHGFTSPQFLAPAAAALLGLALFAHHARASAHPFILPRFLAGRGFRAVNAVNVIGGMIENGLIALVPVYATTRYGISALDSGSLLTGEGVAIILTGGAAAFALRRTGYRLPILVGMIAMVAGVFALALDPHDISPYAWLAAVTGLIGLGAGCLSPASRNAGLQLAPENTPMLAAIRTMCFQIGAIIAIAITTAGVSGAPDAGAGYAHADLIWGALFLLLIPISLRVPEHRGAW
ncbi:MAG: MFS transporter [Rhodanobacteraceae bacterium]